VVTKTDELLQMGSFFVKMTTGAGLSAWEISCEFGIFPVHCRAEFGEVTDWTP
jgi:hypothetical protein